MKLFDNKVIWITGASSGFGEAMAYEFANQGAKIILSSRRIEELERVKSNIKQAEILPLDLLQPEAFKEKVSQALAIYGSIDVVIHNAGIAQNALAIDTTSEMQRKIMDVDFFSYTELTQHLLPHFMERKSGHIVVTSGVLAKVPMPYRSSYCAAKAALHGYFDSLRAEVVDYNINVSILVPSFLNTSLVSKAIGAKEKTSINTQSQGGASVDKAAKQVAKAVYKNKYQVAIGNRDKGRFLLWMSRIFPKITTNLVIKQTRK